MAFLPLGQLPDPLKMGQFLDARNIRGGTITAQQLVIAGGTKGVIRSENFDPSGPTGWAIFGDGSATFGSSVTIGGDIISGNWDGANPANLASIDLTATAGYYLDSSTGTGQLLNLFVGSSAGSVRVTPAFVGGMKFYTGTTETGSVGATSGAFRAIGLSANMHVSAATQGKDLYLSTSGTASGGGSGGDIIMNTLNSGEFDEGQITISDGTAARPILTFINDTDTGIYRPTTNQLAFSTNGAISAHFNAFGHFFMASANNIYADFGAVGDPGYAFNGDDDTGMYRKAANDLAFARGGTMALWLDSSGSATFYDNGGTQQTLSISSGGLLQVEDGSAATPAYGFDNDADVGMYRHAANIIGFTTAANLRVLINNDGLQTSDGSAATPGLSFHQDGDTGMYRASSNHLAFSTGSVLKLQFSTTDSRFDGINDTTTGASPNVFVNSSSGLLARTTSLRAHKSRITYNVDYLADINLNPTKFYRKDDKDWSYGFIAEDLNDQDKLLGEYDVETRDLQGYDSRAILAVLAAKVNRLERELLELRAPGSLAS